MQARFVASSLCSAVVAVLLVFAAAGEAVAGRGQGDGGGADGSSWYRDYLSERQPPPGLFSRPLRPRAIPREVPRGTQVPQQRRRVEPRPRRSAPTRAATPRPSGIYQGDEIPIPTPRPPVDAAQGPIPDGEFMPDEVLATVEGDSAEAQAVAAAFNLEILSERQSGLLGAHFVRYRIPDGRGVEAVAAALAGDPRVIDGAPNHIYALQQARVVNYAFKRIALETTAASGRGVDIAVVDSALDETHEALTGAVVDIYDAMPDYPVETRDHGTSIAGLIAGRGPFLGVAPNARIHHARAFEGGRSSTDILLSALDWAAGKNVRIVNMSFVGPANALLQRACEAARSRGMVLVAAAGNNGPGAPPGYPAAYGAVIAVTATDDGDRVMPQANRGAYVHVSAPGVAILAPIPGGIDAVTGTSFAAAVASGAIANLIESGADAAPGRLERLLAETAMDLGAPGHDEDFGYGLINAGAALTGRE